MTYNVYKIQNLINGKVYIGSSQDVQKRWTQHKNAANNPNNSHYNYPLYQAFRKYKLENFNFTIIGTYNTKEEMEQAEYNYIIQYDSINSQKGYNQTLFTECALRDPDIIKKVLEKKSQKCALVNEKEEIIQIYPSYQEAARQNNMENMANHIRLVCKGIQHSIQNILFFRDLDENNQVVHLNNNTSSKNYRNREKIVAISANNPNELKYYNSIYEAAIELGTDRSSIHSCLRGDSRHSLVKGYIIRKIDENNNIIENNIKVSDKFKEYNEEFPLINGERHTKTEWCRIYNVKWPTIRNRLKKYNITFEQALTASRTDLSSFKRKE